MSYAVESKKRKFHRVLESISKPSTSEDASKASSSTATALDRLPANSSIKRVRLNSSDADLASVRHSILKIPRPTKRTGPATSTKRPTFAPWDRESFLKRLETFRRVDRWTSKPAPINEVQWAKRGWVCTDVARVSCISGCGGSVVVKLPDEMDELDGFDADKVEERRQVRANLVNEYAKLIREGHGDNCPWRNKGCDATIQHLPLANTETAISGLRSRYLNLVKMGDKLPAEDTIKCPEGFDLEVVINVLPDSWFSQPEKAPESSSINIEQEFKGSHQEEDSKTREQLSKPTPINRSALLISCFGWDAVADGTAGLVGCNACFRRLGLWMYKPKQNGDVTVYSSLDAASEHMDYCPWIDKVAQCGSGNPNEDINHFRGGWELVVEALKVKHRRSLRAKGSTNTLQTEPNPPIPDDSLPNDLNEETKKTTDREWWAKIRRVRQILTAKSPRRKQDAS